MLRAAVAALVLSYAPASELCRLQDPAVDESSGVAASAVSDDVFWTHNDSGDAPRFYAFDRAGATVGSFTVNGARADDWEDMARGLSAEGEPALFFADIGDNFRRRPAVTVYEVLEPAVGAAPVVELVQHHELRYEDGSHDAETLLVEPGTRALFVVTKDTAGVAGVYRADGGVLRRVGEIRFDRLVRRPGAYAKAATSGDVSPDGRVVVLRTPFEAFEWTVGEGGLAAAFSGEPRRTRLPETRQGEAIAYTRDGRSLVATSEGAGAPVHVVRGDRAVGPDLLAPRPDAPPAAGEGDGGDDDGEGGNEGGDDGGRSRSWPLVAAAAAAAVVVSLVGLRARAGRRRRRRRRPPGAIPPA